MNDTDAYRNANANKLRESITKVLHWLELNEYSCHVISSCTRPILMTYKAQKNANCWVMIMFDRDYKSIKFSISNGIKVPLAQIKKAQEFIGAFKGKAFSPLTLDLDKSIIWATGAIRIDEEDLRDDEISFVFHVICKAFDDCTPPLLSLIFGNMSIEDAIMDFEAAQKISISEWNADIDRVYEESTSRQNLH